jgi:hypothetical protein
MKGRIQSPDPFVVDDGEYSSRLIKMQLVLRPVPEYQYEEKAEHIPLKRYASNSAVRLMFHPKSLCFFNPVIPPTNTTMGQEAPL